MKYRANWKGSNQLDGSSSRREACHLRLHDLSHRVHHKECNWCLLGPAWNLSIPHYRDVEDVYLGLFINTQEGEQPFHVIGVKSKEPIDRFQDSLMMNLRKDYYKHVRFEIMALDSSDVSTKLIEQGNHLKILNS
jgi:hypothetical protein